MTTLKGKFVTLTPLAHTEPKTKDAEKSNISEIRKMKINYNGEIYKIPYLSGNSLRAELRHSLVEEFISILGITKEELAIHDKDLYYTLFSGGSLESTKHLSQTEKVKKDKEEITLISDLIKKTGEISFYLPTLNVFGGVFMNNIIEGRINVGNLVPLTKQNASLYDITETETLPNCGEIIDFIGFVGHDIMRKDFPVELMEMKEMDKPKAKKDDPDPSSKAKEEIKDKNRPIPFHMEAICPNVTMLMEINIKPSASEIEKSAVVRAIEHFNNHPVVGLRSSAGFGQLKGQIETGDLTSEQYLDHIKQNANKIKDYIMGKARKKN